MNKKLKKIPSGVRFLILMVLVYAFVGVSSPQFLSFISKNLLQNLKEITPILCFVFFIIFLINLFVKPQLIKKHLGSESGIKGWLYVLVGSVFIIGPPYVIFPILKELKSHGMKNSLIATFMNNRNVQPAFLPVMAHYFGWSFTLVISFYSVIFTILTGLLVGKIVDKENNITI